MPESSLDTIELPRVKALSRAKQRLDWQVNREQRREAIAKGYVASFLRDHPDRLSEIVTAAAQAAQEGHAAAEAQA